MKQRRINPATWMGFALALALPCGAAAQASSPTTMAAVPANYQVGLGDVLNVVVLNDTDLNETTTVDPNGAIPLPVTRRNIEVAGKTVTAIDQEVEKGLVQDQQERAPHVSVTVAAVESKPVSVSGAVHQPGTWQAITPFTLLDIVNRAGGTTDPGAIIDVKKSQPDGSDTVVFSTTLPKLLQSTSVKDNPLLSGNETVVVMTGGKIYVGGQVNHPGTIAMDASEQITVIKAFALAGQNTKIAALNKAVIYHASGEAGLGPEQPVDLKKILAHKAPDVVLQADDFLYIPQSGAKAFGYGVLTGAQSALTMAAGAALTGIP